MLGCPELLLPEAALLPVALRAPPLWFLRFLVLPLPPVSLPFAVSPLPWSPVLPLLWLVAVSPLPFAVSPLP
eukprot:10985836-Heterocapsa_arctica.AAC.1